MKKRTILFLCLLVGHLTVSRAKPFEQAEVTKAVNIVSLLPQARRTVPGDVVTGNTALKTGGDSRAELQFPDLTITRVGSNALFRFVAGTREMILDSGTMLFSSPEGAGGGTVQAGAVTAAVTGSEFMISNVGRVKVICLSHKVTVYLTANPKVRTELQPGQVLDIPTGTERKMPRPTTINLGKLLATSRLNEAGGFRPLPSQTTLLQNVKGQRRAFSLPNLSATSESAEVLRSSGELSANSSSLSRQTEAAQITREAEKNTPASSTAGNGTRNGNSGNNKNAGKSGNNQKSDNSSNNENRGNRGNNENRGSSVNNENRGNRGNNENRGSSVNNENRGNRGNNENRGNSGNNQNRGNGAGRGG